jgi:hypothetical protein
MTATFPDPPTPEEAMDTARRVFNFAERISAGDKKAALDDMGAWFASDSFAALRVWYLATIGPILAMGLVKKYFPVDMAPDDFWVLQQLPDVPADDDPHAYAMAQVLVRYMNDDEATAHDLLHAHANTYGIDGLFSLGCQSVKFMAGLLAYGREQGGAA